jgi:hypothetical protein
VYDTAWCGEAHDASPLVGARSWCALAGGAGVLYETNGCVCDELDFVCCAQHLISLDARWGAFLTAASYL